MDLKIGAGAVAGCHPEFVRFEEKKLPYSCTHCYNLLYLVNSNTFLKMYRDTPELFSFIVDFVYDAILFQRIISERRSARSIANIA